MRPEVPPSSCNGWPYSGRHLPPSGRIVSPNLTPLGCNLRNMSPHDETCRSLDAMHRLQDAKYRRHNAMYRPWDAMCRPRSVKNRTQGAICRPEGSVDVSPHADFPYYFSASDYGPTNLPLSDMVGDVCDAICECCDRLLYSGSYNAAWWIHMLCVNLSSLISVKHSESSGTQHNSTRYITSRERYLTANCGGRLHPKGGKFGGTMRPDGGRWRTEYSQPVHLEGGISGAPLEPQKCYGTYVPVGYPPAVNGAGVRYRRAFLDFLWVYCSFQGVFPFSKLKRQVNCQDRDLTLKRHVVSAYQLFRRD